MRTPDDGQRSYPKHVEFYSKNKFEELVHLVGFIMRIYHDARSPERQISNKNKVLTFQSDYICCVFSVGSHITVNITIKIVIANINS